MEELNQIRQLCENFEHTDFKYGTLYHVDFNLIVNVLKENNIKVDLILTDPPYNVNAKAKDQAKKDTPEEKVSYDDKKDDVDYNWFISNLIWDSQKVSNMLVVSPGHSNISLWVLIKEPDDYLFHNKPDGQGFSKNSRANKTELYLVYGMVSSRKKFATNTIKANINHHIRYGPHPHPKPPELYKKIVSQLNPTIVFDPFLGSGTTGVVCEELGVPWIGCEIMQEYIDACIIPRCSKAETPTADGSMREL